MEYSEGMQVLRSNRVFAPAIVRMGDSYHVFSRTTLESSGATIEEALQAGGFLPPPPRRALPYVAVGANVVQGNEGIAICRSNTVAARVANALNEYTPGDRGF